MCNIMAFVEIECVICDLVNKLFSRRSFSEKSKIIKTGNP